MNLISKFAETIGKAAGIARDERAVEDWKPGDDAVSPGPIPFHPLANLFPLMPAGELDELVEDMRANGFRTGEEIVLCDGMILDGRNRYRALWRLAEAGEVDEADLDPKRGWLFVHFSDDGPEGVFSESEVARGPLGYVISRNLRRRHLSTGQKAMLAAKLATLSPGRPSPGEGISADQAAAMLNVSESSVERARVVQDKGAPELRAAVDRGEVSVSAAAEVSALPQDEQAALVAEGEKAVSSAAKTLRKGERAVMASRVEADDSLDYFPTPPWATRALIEHVLPHIGVTDIGHVWEPACGEGHIAGVVQEYAHDPMFATDVHDYSVDGREPPSWGGAQDFLSELRAVPHPVDWIITNPPFGEKALAFVLRSLDIAADGVAMFVQLRWLETIDRYEEIFRDRPPVVVAPFVERVNLCKGRWDPKGSTATAYCWIVWRPNIDRQNIRTELFWIPPGCRESLAREDDVDRFTAHPVKARAVEPPPPAEAVSEKPKTKPKLTKAKRARESASQRDQEAAAAALEAETVAHAARLAALPLDVDDLAWRYGMAIGAYHRAWLEGNEAGVTEQRGEMDLLRERAAQIDDEPIYASTAAAEVLSRNRAAPGEVPKWGQAGVFIAEADGVRAWVQLEESPAIYAVDFNAPFPSETGFHSAMEMTGILGMTPEEAGGVMIREIIDYATSKKTNSFAKGLVRPEHIYRLATAEDGDDAEDGLVRLDRGVPVEMDMLPPTVDAAALEALFAKWRHARLDRKALKKAGLPPPDKRPNEMIVSVSPDGSLLPVEDFPVDGVYLVGSYDGTLRYVADGTDPGAAWVPPASEGEEAITSAASNEAEKSNAPDDGLGIPGFLRRK